ncbi:MAG: lytic murein transglycosylase [Chloroflexi bacterium]|nr:lytic murein transglycosylase [Chloroflexota bacterium]
MASKSAVPVSAATAATTSSSDAVSSYREGAGSADSPPGDDDVVEAPVDWQAYVPTDIADHLATMDRAARDSNCGVPWQLLAAIARVESDFGRNMATSSAGAIGYGQFLPSSWQSFGSDGNAYDYRDALPAIALYLCQAGLERDPRAALFAYNHADWYVDMVLDLAVRYDRMAPGAPTPDVLGVGPDTQQAMTVRYGSGRDVRLQSRSRAMDGGVRWLGVPWRGRTAGQPIATPALEATALSMLRTGFGMRADVTTRVGATSEDLRPLANAAWDDGLLGLPGNAAQWSAAEVRQHLQLGHPVVAFVGSRGLPGHPVDEDDGEQPLVLIGTAPDGFIYNDPTFSSSLGYGLEISETDLFKFWDTAARPRQALAFVPRPQPRPEAHLGEAEAPEPIARELPTATPVPAPTAVPSPVVAVTDVPIPRDLVVPTRAPVASLPNQSTDAPPYGLGAIGVGAMGALGALAFTFRRRRGGRRP